MKNEYILSLKDGSWASIAYLFQLSDIYSHIWLVCVCVSLYSKLAHIGPLIGSIEKNRDTLHTILLRPSLSTDKRRTIHICSLYMTYLLYYHIQYPHCNTPEACGFTACSKSLCLRSEWIAGVTQGNHIQIYFFTLRKTCRLISTHDLIVYIVKCSLLPKRVLVWKSDWQTLSCKVHHRTP